MQTKNSITQAITEMDLKHSKLRLRKDGILEMICDDDTVFDVDQIKEVIDNIGIICNGKKCKQITIAGLYSSVTREAREYMAKDEGVLFTSAEAYVIQSLPQRIIGNFYLKFNKPKVPTKIFTDREKAEKWLQSVDITS